MDNKEYIPAGVVRLSPTLCVSWDSGWDGDHTVVYLTRLYEDGTVRVLDYISEDTGTIEPLATGRVPV